MSDRRFYPGRQAMTQTLLCVAVFLLSSFNPPSRQQATNNCTGTTRFYGYTFLDPDVINRNAAYAPFFTRWDDYYERYYFSQGEDIQKDENLQEWKERFCNQPLKEDIEYVVYKADVEEISRLHVSAADAGKKSPLPYRMAGNTFAEMIATNGCTEVTAYLMYAKKCEPYVTGRPNAWDSAERQSEDMIALIDEGLGRFKDTDSHFIKMRYAYQMIRLAHYARDWKYTVDLFHYLIPKIDRKKNSIIYFWTLGHLAGALQKLGKYPEAAYRYSLIFRYCPSKRAQAFRSFVIRNDDDWDKTMKMCESDAERSTLLVMRAGGARTFLIADMQEVYDLDPGNPQLDLMLVSEVQELEKIYWSTPVTTLKKGRAIGSLKSEAAAQHLLDLQKFVRKVIREKHTPNLKFWRGMESYLELMAGDKYAAEKGWDRLEDDLDDGEEYDRRLFQQLETWRCLLEIVKLDLNSDRSDNLAFRIRGYQAFKRNPNFEPFLQQWLSAGYAAQNHPGKAILAAYDPGALGLNPKLEVYDDLLALADSDHPILLERTMQIDTNPARIKARLLELKGAYLLSQGQPEAALAVMRRISAIEASRMSRFTPFREKFGEKIHRGVVIDSLSLTRLEIAQKLVELEFRAKTAAAQNQPEAAVYWYRMGVAYYNMTYFGYEWEVTDAYRSGYNQLRLAQGPVFPLAGSPDGNRENLDTGVALSYFDKAMHYTEDPELAARAAFMAARCRQKQYFCSPECTYKPGTDMAPVLPDAYMDYYKLLTGAFPKTKFYNAIVKECKWLALYAR